MARRRNVKQKEKARLTWSKIPNEIKALVTKQLDLRTSISLGQCSLSDYSIATRFPPNEEISIDLEYFKKSSMTIKMFDSKDQLIFSWKMEPAKNVKYGSNITHMDSNQTVLYSRELRNIGFTRAAFQLIGKFSKDPRILLNKLTIKLKNFIGNVNFGNPIANLETLELIDCMHKSTIFSIFKNLKTTPTAINFGLNEFRGIGYSFNFMDVLKIPMVSTTQKLLLNFPVQYRDADLLKVKNDYLVLQQSSITNQGINTFLKNLLGQKQSNEKNIKGRCFSFDGRYHLFKDDVSNGMYRVELPDREHPTFLFGLPDSKFCAMVTFRPTNIMGLLLPAGQFDFRNCEIFNVGV